MPAFRLRASFLCFCLIGILSWSGAAYSAPPPPLDLDDSRSALSIGEELERSAKWLDAVQHYENALKRWPDDESLVYGKRRAKAHFKIERRYADKSFQASLLAMSEGSALELYDELLSNVRRNFVDDLSYKSVVAHGTESVYIALANPKFLEANLPAARSDQDRAARKENILRVRQTLREKFWNREAGDREQARAIAQQVGRITHQNLGIQPAAIVMEYIFGGCNSLDDYSGFLTADRLADLYSNIDGEFVGIGVEMKAAEGKGMLLVNVLPESPASAAGLKKGDHIIAIDNADVRKATIDEAANMLKGHSGSRVRLKVARDEGKPIEAVLNRREVHVKSVQDVKFVDTVNQIAYVKLAGFQKSTSREFDEAMTSLQRQGMKGLILDVRGNPGGLLTAAVEVLDRLVDNGVLVSTKGRSNDQNWTYRAQQNGAVTVPLVLLTDGDSASASEIVAGCVRDLNRGTIVGRKTYGKWSVQSIFHVGKSTGLRLTTARFYSPNGNTYGHVGVEPDVLVELPDERTARFRPTSRREAEDADVEKGIEVLRGKIGGRN